MTPVASSSQLGLDTDDDFDGDTLSYKFKSKGKGAVTKSSSAGLLKVRQMTALLLSMTTESKKLD